MITVVIVPEDNRYEALDAYRDWLSDQQIELFKDAPNDAFILLYRVSIGDGKTRTDMEITNAQP